MDYSCAPWLDPHLTSPMTTKPRAGAPGRVRAPGDAIGRVTDSDRMTDTPAFADKLSANF